MVFHDSNLEVTKTEVLEGYKKDKILQEQDEPGPSIDKETTTWTLWACEGRSHVITGVGDSRGTQDVAMTE